MKHATYGESVSDHDGENLVAPAQLVDTEVSIWVKDSNGEWYGVPFEEVTQFQDCYYLMIGTSTETWTYLPEMENRDFLLNGTRCTVERVRPDWADSDRFVVREAPVTEEWWEDGIPF